MADTGSKYPGSVVDLASTGQAAWVNPSYAATPDGNSASVTLGPADNKGDFLTDVLFASNFGLTVPTGVTITGIQVDLNGTGTGYVYLYKSSSTSVGNGKFAALPSGSYVSLGGSNDLWGATLSPADVNASTFGVGFVANNSYTQSSAGATMDAIRITVYWSTINLPQTGNYRKRYEYKTYNSGVYKGNLPNVKSEFEMLLDINTAGTSINVTVGATIDNASSASSAAILDENGNAVLDESGNAILSDGSQILAGLGTNSSLIRNGNEVVVWEYSGYWPNGHIVFRGIIERWSASFGGDDGETDDINLYIYSEGEELDNYILLGSPYTYNDDQVQTSQNASDIMYSSSGDKDSGFKSFGQSFTVGQNVNNIGAVYLLLNGSANVTLNIYSNNTFSNLVGTISQSVSVSGANVVRLALASNIKVTPGAQMAFTASVDNGQSIAIYYQNSDVYSGGTFYSALYGGGSGGGSFSPDANKDLWFKTASSTGQTIATFTNVDPTTGMLVPFMADYSGRGGGVTVGQVDATGLTLSYKFSTQTIFEGLNIVLGLAPAGFYYTIDVATNVLTFRKVSQTPDFYVTKGRNVAKLNIVATIENVHNFGLFSGAQVNGSNIYTSAQDAASIALYGIRLYRQSDNRVDNLATAQAVIGSTIADQKDEKQQTTVTILDKTMDISQVKVGMVVGFRNYGNFIDSLMLQIVRLDYTPDRVLCTLGVLPVSQALQIDQVTRGLIAQETVANPSSPS